MHASSHPQTQFAFAGANMVPIAALKSHTDMDLSALMCSSLVPLAVYMRSHTSISLGSRLLASVCTPKVMRLSVVASRRILSRIGQHTLWGARATFFSGRMCERGHAPQC